MGKPILLGVEGPGAERSSRATEPGSCFETRERGGLPREARLPADDAELRGRCGNGMRPAGRRISTGAAWPREMHGLLASLKKMTAMV